MARQTTVWFLRASVLVALLVACEDGGGDLRVDDAAYVTTCDVRDPVCATVLFHAVEAVYGARHPQIENVVTHAEPDEAPGYEGYEWGASLSARELPVIHDRPGPSPQARADDPSAADDPLPEPLGRVRERGDGDVVELVYTYPGEEPWAGDSASRPRMRRLGFVVGALASLRAVHDPEHPIDVPVPGLDPALAHAALRVALGHEALLTLEGLADGARDEPFDTALAELDALGDRLLDDDVTPGRAPAGDSLRAAALRWIAALRGDGTRGRDIAVALRDGPRCERQLFDPDASCYHVPRSSVYETEQLGFRVVGVFRFGTDELWSDVLRPAGRGEEDRAAAHAIAAHFGVLWLRLEDDALVREDFFYWESEDAAETVYVALMELALERIGPPSDPRLYSGYVGASDDWSVVIRRDDDVVRAVQGPPDVDLEAFFSHVDGLDAVYGAAR